MGWTTTDLISSIRRRASIPTAGGDYTDAVLMSMADEETDAHIMPMLIELAAEYLVHTYDVAIVAGTTAYRIPTRAIGAKLRDAMLLSSAGDEISLAKIEREHVGDAEQRASSMFEGAGLMFYLQHNHVKLAPAPTSNHATYSLRLPYYRHPNRLVAPTACATVVSKAGATIVTTGIPATMTAGVLCDVIQAKPHFDWLNTDLVIQNVATPPNIVFTTSVSTEIVAGDYVCLAEQSPIPQLPPELHRLLAQYTAVQVAENEGDNDVINLARSRLVQMIEEAKAMLSPRVDGEPSVCVNRYSTLNAARGAYRRYV